MDEKRLPEQRPANNRRKKRTQMEIFKEAYLPAFIACAAVIMIIIFIVGSITRSIQRGKIEDQLEVEASATALAEQEVLDAEANQIAEEAALLAESYDYEGALEKIESFSGIYTDYAILNERHQQYTQALSEMVVWNDPSKVLNLSFHLLIADPQRAFNFSDSYLKQKFNENFITVSEFRIILQELYKNGYILIDVDDITTGTEIKSLSLPAGKKPLILTQTNVNYYNYMIDGNDDNIPDAEGAGFASRLVIDANGNITSEMVNSTGEIVTGAYDMVPVLESFIQTHPDFSYRGAKAVLAVSGEEGIFGYRINHSAVTENKLTAAQYEKEITGAKEICAKLKELGYHIACYTYANTGYADKTPADIHVDMKKWTNEIEPIIKPILGSTKYFVFAQNSDIGAPGVAYSGEQFEALSSYGFTHYFGFCSANNMWYYQGASYMRQGRILVTGSALTNHPDWFAGVLNPTTVLDGSRNNTTA